MYNGVFNDCIRAAAEYYPPAGDLGIVAADGAVNDLGTGIVNRNASATAGASGGSIVDDSTPADNRAGRNSAIYSPAVSRCRIIGNDTIGNNRICMICAVDPTAGAVSASAGARNIIDQQTVADGGTHIIQVNCHPVAAANLTIFQNA